jgi:hypothetical protein
LGTHSRATLGAALVLQPRLKTLPFQASFFLGPSPLVDFQTLWVKLAMPSQRQGIPTTATEVLKIPWELYYRSSSTINPTLLAELEGPIKICLWA